ncbi:spore gernimation protein, partial [Vibrio parahaemolyticus]
MFATIVTSVIGVSVFSYASDLCDIVGNDGWIVIIISALINFALIYIMYLIIRLNNYDEFYKIVGFYLLIWFIPSIIITRKLIKKGLFVWGSKKKEK